MRMRLVLESIIRDEEGREASWEVSAVDGDRATSAFRRRESRDGFETI